jgi:uncharacterized protein (TIGR03086 family)
MSSRAAEGQSLVPTEDKAVMHDLGPAARELARLVSTIRDDQLGDPTPCEAYSLGDLLDHVRGFTENFTANARKQPLPADVGRTPDGGRLPSSWRTALPARLQGLAVAWQDEAAWQGRVSAGGIEMSAAHNALVAVEELVVHGWDVSRASGQHFAVDDASLGGVEHFFTVFGERIAAGLGPYGPAVAVPADASRLDRLLGATGRDPDWSPATR